MSIILGMRTATPCDFEPLIIKLKKKSNMNKDKNEEYGDFKKLKDAGIAYLKHKMPDKDISEFTCFFFQTVREVAIQLLVAIGSHVRHPTAGQDFLFHRFECHTAGACLPARQCGHEAMQEIQEQ